MDENKLENLLLRLTRSAIWAEEPSTEGFPLSEEEWYRLHFMAVKQTVHGIIYHVVCQLPEALLPPGALLLQWMKEAQLIEQDYLNQVRTLGWLTSRIESESSLTPIILKGLPLATLYPTPSLRYSGDIDVFYGSLARCLQANKLVEGWGIPVMGGGSENEYSYMLGHVEVEHHGHMILSHVPILRQRLMAWTEHHFSQPGATRKVDVEGMTVSALAPRLDLVQLSSHSLKHILNVGIGLRQLCDITLFVNHYHEDLRQPGMRELLSRFGVRRWTDICLTYCVTYLGLPEDRLPYPLKASRKRVESMHREVMRTGNFGHYDERNLRRPESGAASKAFTARRILRNAARYLTVSPLESVSSIIDLTMIRLGELTNKTTK